MDDAHLPRSHTIQLRPPFGGALMIAAVFLMLYLGMAELLIRAIPVHLVLGAPGLGSKHRQFEQQWNRLRDYVARHGSVDCIMLGDSTVMSDFSPAAFTEAYRRQTGTNIACYNFGVGAISVVGSSVLAPILVRAYSPRFLIVGVEALNFTVPRDEQGNADLSGVPWARYRLGEFTLEGWLYDHSHLYPYMGALRQLLTFEVDYKAMMQLAEDERRVSEDGHSPLEGSGPLDVTKRPESAIDHPYIEHYFAALAPFRLLPENLEALDKIMVLNNSSTRIVLVEMPVTDTFHTFFGNDEQDYKKFVDTIGAQAAAKNVSLWRFDDLQLLPSTVWWNYNHLNAEGASIFSGWLGTKLGQESAE